MPTIYSSAKTYHLLQNGFLIVLLLFFTPPLTFIAISSWLLSPYLNVTKHIKHHRNWRQISSSTFKPRRILITGVGNSKGLSLSRNFYRAGHTVIGADFEPYLIPVPGHFSTTIETFYRLSKPSQIPGSARYIRDLIDLVKAERIELWVPCSEGSTVVEDAEAAEAIEKETDCKVVQFGMALTEMLHDKYSYSAHTRKLGLNVPETHLVTSETEALVILYPEQARARKWVMKAVKVDSRVGESGASIVLPKETGKETETEVKRLNPTPFRPYVLQAFIQGFEYCSHALIIEGKVKSFVACPTKGLSMHYTSLSTSSALSQAMLLYTTLYARRTGSSMTGHLSLGYLVSSDVAREAEYRTDVEQAEVRELMEKIFSVECDPRAHTAMLAFRDVSEDLADAYLTVLPKHEPQGLSNGHRDEPVVVPRPGVKGYYWFGSDFVSSVLLPVVQLLKYEIGLKGCAERWMEFVEHVLFWREATYEVWDPWPTWWMYAGYWPMLLMTRAWEGGNGVESFL